MNSIIQKTILEKIQKISDIILDRSFNNGKYKDNLETLKSHMKKTLDIKKMISDGDFDKEKLKELNTIYSYYMKH